MNDDRVELPFRILEFVELRYCSQKNNQSRRLLRVRLQVAPFSLSPSSVTRKKKRAYSQSIVKVFSNQTLCHAGYDVGRFPFDQKIPKLLKQKQGQFMRKCLGNVHGKSENY